MGETSESTGPDNNLLPGTEVSLASPALHGPEPMISTDQSLSQAEYEHAALYITRALPEDRSVNIIKHPDPFPQY